MDHYQDHQLGQAAFPHANPALLPNAHRLRHSATILHTSNTPTVITVALRALCPHGAMTEAVNHDSGDTNATPDTIPAGTRLLVVRISHARSASSGRAMKRLFLAVGVLSAGLLTWTPTSTAAPSLWQASVTIENQVASQPTKCGGHPLSAGSIVPSAGRCRPGMYNANLSESWLAVRPGAEDLVGTSKIFFEKYSTFYMFRDRLVHHCMSAVAHIGLIDVCAAKPPKRYALPSMHIEDAAQGSAIAKQSSTAPATLSNSTLMIILRPPSRKRSSMSRSWPDCTTAPV
jgi:hypothetical protein